MVRAGLERDVRGRAFRVAGRDKRIYFRVFASCLFVPAFTDDVAVAHEHATHYRVGRRAVPAAYGKLQRARHECAVTGGEIRHCRYRFFLPNRSGSNDICSRLAAASEMRCSLFISSSNSVMSWNRR